MSESGREGGTRRKSLEDWIKELSSDPDWPFVLNVVIGKDEADQGMFFDAEGNDRTVLIKGLIARLDAAESRLAGVADRVAVLERIVVTDEAKLSEEIERLRDRPGARR